MFNFEALQLNKPLSEYYKLSNPKTNDKNKRKRLVLSFKKNNPSLAQGRECYIWNWQNENEEIKDSQIYQLYWNLNEVYNSPIQDKLVLPIKTINDDPNKVVLVIYQSSNDSWKNFLRQIHCYDRRNNQYEIFLIFNNENLRKNKWLNGIYRIIRRILYKRLDDVETFIINIENDTPHFIFRGIYSKTDNLEYDSTHKDKGWFFREIPNRNITYYYSDNKHPIIFINTANHAMAEHDNNPDLWKWEYAGWELNSLIILGEKSREDIENILTKFNKQELIDNICKSISHECANKKGLPIFDKHIESLKREHLLSEFIAEEIVNEVKKKIDKPNFTH